METIQDAITGFINHCRFEKNLSEKTIEAYQTDLAQLTTFFNEMGYSTEISLISKVEIRGFLESISRLKPKSIKRKMATLKAMFNFLEFDDRISVNPFRKMKIKIHEPIRLPKAMDLNDVNSILKSAYRQSRACCDFDSYSCFESLRNIIVLELLFATGARVSEIANLTTSSINTESGVITIIGKGNKERIIQVCNKETLLVLREYLRKYKKKIKKAGDYILVNRFGNRLSDQSIRGIVKNVSKQAKIKEHVTPHVFRHTLATLLLENDVDIKYIQSILGHSSIMTTQIYTHVNREKQRQILETKHPRKELTFEIV